MKQVCLLCERTSIDNNLYCQEIYCPAEMSPIILGYGEYLGNIEIVRPIIVQRASVLYEVRHEKKKVLLKIAHAGPENTERLKREATFLRDLRLKKEQNRYLPAWLPPYEGQAMDAKTDPYGRAMLGGHLLYYYLFEHFPGETLRDVLTKRPQLWVNHLGWIMTDMSSAVAHLQSKGMFHLALGPESILVDFDTDTNIPRILLHDLGIASDLQTVAANWYPFLVPPAYTAPELMRRPIVPSYATDVYGLGLTLYELLVGEPCFPFKLRGDDEVYNAVRANMRVRMNRTEDVKAVADIALQAVANEPQVRQQSAADLADQLLKNFSQVPAQKKNRRPSLNTCLIFVISVLAIAFLITFVVTISQIAV
jgi:serine/threonine protein kinase